MAGLVGVGPSELLRLQSSNSGIDSKRFPSKRDSRSKELEILQFAASQAGVGTDQLNAAVQKFSINIGKASDGTKLQADAFKALNIEIKDQDGTLKDSSALFVEVAESISKIEEPADKARIASDLFGRTGVELLALLNTGAIGLGEFARSSVKPEGSWERRRRMNSRHLTIKWIFFLDHFEERSLRSWSRSFRLDRTCRESR